MNRDDRRARSIGRAEASRKTGDATFDLEPTLLQDVCHQLGGLELLHAELAEIEDAIAGERDRLGVAVDVIEHKALLGREIVAIAHFALLTLAVMPGLVQGIHDFSFSRATSKTWMAGTS